MGILFVENHPIFAQIVRKKFLSNYDVDIVPSLESAFNLITRKDYECVLVDYDLDDGKGDVFVQVIQETHPQLKIVAISSHEAGNMAMLAVGAHAVCPKMKFKQINAILKDISVSMREK